MTVCGGAGCSTTCTSWTATSGQCSKCDTGKGACSMANPSSITTSSSITFYADDSCSSGFLSEPVTVDGQCHNTADGFLSIRATNTSAIIG